MKQVSKKKILFYNWIQFDEPDNIGGGVNVYQKNLINELSKKDDYEIYFLSSGIYYDLIRKKLRIEKTKNIFSNKCKSFRIVNSPCTAPMSTMYQDLDVFLNDENLYLTFVDFIRKCGEFDIIHFNNIEGLSSKCLEIKKDFPQTMVFFSIHNYLLFTPEANMFYLNKDDRTKTVKKKASKKQAIKFYKIDSILRKMNLSKLGAKILKSAKNFLNRDSEINNEPTQRLNNKDIKRYCDENVKRVNRYVDKVLAVSERTKEIAINYGIKKDIITTEYIGTEVAKKAQYKLHDIPKHDGFTIAYMGYFDRAKGFDFLIDALEKMPEELAKKMNFVCYAKVKKDTDNQYIERITKLNSRFLSARHFNGYTHDQFKEIMSTIDLGIVPVIWEDNLPQVAIEYAAYGVPVLASDLGGAHELSGCEDFVFEAGNAMDFYEKVEKICNDYRICSRYFNKMNRLNTNEMHLKSLESIYG